VTKIRITAFGDSTTNLPCLKKLRERGVAVMSSWFDGYDPSHGKGVEFQVRHPSSDILVSVSSNSSCLLKLGWRSWALTNRLDGLIGCCQLSHALTISWSRTDRVRRSCGQPANSFFSLTSKP